ncbi:MAG TPA: carbohydrate kinase [Bacteroidota bacterium]|nr:carbohydrate kinase [Bacteroidota bacterium]
MKIICVGEVLWDLLPSGMFLGGAPFNVACDLHQLGCATTMISRVGDDDSGRRVIDVMRARGMDRRFIQTDPVLPTGVVHVRLDAKGMPQFTIDRPAAWDAIESPHQAVSGDEESSSILVFGSLAQRSERSRATIHALQARVPVSVFDVNLRQPYDDAKIVHSSLARSTIVKLNSAELLRIAEWFGLPSSEKEFCETLHSEFGCETVCITRDAHGAALWHNHSVWIEHPGFSIDVKDTVGAGDAFLAGFISRLSAGAGWNEILEYSNLMGAFVASRDGATPEFSQAEIRAFAASARLR